MVCFKVIVLVSAISCLIGVEMKPLNGRIVSCKLIPFKKHHHHSLLESLIPSIVVAPDDSAVPIEEYAVPIVTEPVPVPTAVPAEPQQEVQQEVQYPAPQPEVQYPDEPQPEVQYPDAPQPEVQYPDAPQPEVQYPDAPQPEVQYPESQPPAAPQPEVLPNPVQQQPLYPPQHEGQRPVQHYPQQQQQPAPSNQGLYPPQLQQDVQQYYPAAAQNKGPQGGYGVPPPPQVYQGFTNNNNVPYNYPVYGQNVLRSLKSLDGHTYQLRQLPYRANNGFVRQPTPSVYYNYAPPLVYGSAYAASPQYNYVPQAPRTALALTREKAKST